ncbi:MAG: HAMP domain-containing sensor histidine kinase [Synechococcales bacterium]|nr:HAMP domain-containing sensor histidine kinase [Synechococcales bacterium]
MTLLKRCMGWGIGLIQNFRQDGDNLRVKRFRATVRSSEFRALSWRLLLSYVGAMGAVFTLSTVAIYQSVAHSLYARLDERMVTLADAAAHNLPAILAGQQVEASPPLAQPDDDGDLDLPWQDLQEASQGLEWFDAQGQLQGRSGSQFFGGPLQPGSGFQTQQAEEMYVLTVPVYASRSETPRQLLGYVRVSQSAAAEHEELERLLYGMGWGGVLAIALIGTTGWWLTQRSLQPIEQSVHQLKQFTADASHELRSPITAIRTAVEVMQTHPERIHPADVTKLELIASATQHMGRLVEDLLILARSDTSSDHSSSTGIAIPIDELLDDLVQWLQPQAQTQAIQLATTPLPEVQVRGDADQLRRLFLNLLENALHYTPAGGSVQVSLALQDAYPPFACIHVKDTGIGIAPEQIPHVFDRFWRADQARDRRSGGTGLGLAIAQAIARIHGGKITVTSQLGVGSCFRVEIPAIAPQKTPQT